MSSPSMDKAESPSRRFLRRRQQHAAMGEYGARFSLALDVGGLGCRLYRRLPCKRHWVAILISFGILAVFSIPLLTAGSMVGQLDADLFSLVSVLFSLFWLMGWSVGVFALAAVFLVLSVGRETLRVRDNALILRIGIPGLAFGASYHGDAIRNFRTRSPKECAGSEWRGEHLAFDYGDDTIGFGSAIGPEEARQLLGELKAAFPRHGSAPMQFPALLDTVPEPAASSARPLPSSDEAIGYGSLSSLALILANLLPLFGVVLLGWDLGQIMLLYWAESAVVGFFTLCKMAKVAGWITLFYGPFFIGHFGGFMVVHLLFVYGLFINGLSSNQATPLGVVADDFLAMAPAMLGFFISHGISFVSNFLGRQEFKRTDVGEQMSQPYKRIALMHVTIIFGGFLVLAFQSPLAGMLLFVLLKLVADLKAHVAQHRPATATQA